MPSIKQNMKRIETYKKIIFCFIGIGFTVHILFTFIYNFDKITEHAQIRKAVFMYMFPLFNQNNKVFAPDPPFCKQELWVQYKSAQGKWTPWLNPQKEMLERHVKNRLSPVGMHIKLYDYLLRLLYDAHIYAEYYIESSQLPNSDSLKLKYLKHYDGFNMAQHYFSKYVQKSETAVPYDSMHYKIEYVYPEKFKAHKFKNIKATKLVINFPTVAVLKSK